jgi:hypothetical protein
MGAPRIVHQYPDGGCPLSPSCNDCPLPACLADIRGSFRGVRYLVQGLAVARSYAAGMKANDVARTYGIGRRSVFRIVARVRELGVLQ